MKTKINKFTIISLAILLVAFAIIYKWSGLRWIIGALLLFYLPYYAILRKTNLDDDEKIIFAAFIGLGVTPSILYYINLIIPSFKTALLITLILLILISVFFLYKTSFFKKEKQTETNSE